MSWVQSCSSSVFGIAKSGVEKKSSFRRLVTRARVRCSTHSRKCRLVGVIILIFALGIYAYFSMPWQARRCIERWLWPTAKRRLECSEALLDYHVEHFSGFHLASADQLGAAPPKDVPQIIHFTLHGLPEEDNVAFPQGFSPLAVCALESALRLSTHRVRLWVDLHASQQGRWGDVVELSTRVRAHLTGLGVDVSRLTVASYAQQHLRPGARGCSHLVLVEEWLCREFFRKGHTPGVLSAHWSDAFRVAIISRYGGSFLDLDSPIVSPRFSLVPEGSLVANINRRDDIFLIPKAYALTNGLFAFSPSNPFLVALQQDILREIERWQAVPADVRPYGWIGPAAIVRTYTSEDPWPGAVVRARGGNWRDEHTTVFRPNVLLHGCDSLLVHLYHQTQTPNQNRREGRACERKLLQQACPASRSHSSALHVDPRLAFYPADYLIAKKAARL